MTVSSLSFQNVIDRMSRISSLNVRNNTTVSRSASVGKSAGIEKSASAQKTTGVTGSRSTGRTGSSSLYVSSAQKTGAGFRKIAEKLQNTDWSRDYKFSKKKELQNNVRTFAEEYNKLLSGVKNVSDGAGSTYGSKFTQLLRDNKEALSGIGLEVGTDGTLSVNSKVLKKAKADSFETVFQGADSVAGKAAVNSIYAEAQSMLSGMGKLYGYSSLYGYGSAYGTYGLGALGTYGLGNLGAYGLGALGSADLSSMAIGNYGIQNGSLLSYGLGGYGYGAYGYGASGLNSLYAALSSYAGRYIDTQL
ncbi:MAG: hypothetical protein HDR08_00550 [Lachnospiraceae bacterium]|nr:hypothetical protein [Lachnospiraceae bacterium]